MGNKPVKQRDTSCPSFSHRENKFYDDNAAYVFNFYGKYSEEEFKKANVDDPKLEMKVKEEVDEYIEMQKRCMFRSMSHNIYHNDVKYGFAFFHEAYINPFLKLTLECTNRKDGNINEDTKDTVLYVARFLDHKCLKIVHGDLNINWKLGNIDATVDYVFEILQGKTISSITNDFDVQVDMNEDPRDIVKRCITYMMNIESK